MDLKTKPVQLATDAKLEGFRSHDAEGQAQAMPVQQAAPRKEAVLDRASGREARISKTVRMRLRFSEMLRDESYRRTVEKGEKVSEADLLDEALHEWRHRHGVISD